MDMNSEALSRSYHIRRSDFIGGAARILRAEAVGAAQAGGVPLRVAEAARRFALPSVVLALLMTMTAIIAGRDRVVSIAPITGPAFSELGLLASPNGLAIRDVQARISDLGGARVLLVEGSIVAIHDSTTRSPDLSIILTGADGRQLYKWIVRAPRKIYARNSPSKFTARLEAPPEGVEDATVEFADGEPELTRRVGGT